MAGVDARGGFGFVFVVLNRVVAAADAGLPEEARLTFDVDLAFGSVGLRDVDNRSDDSFNCLADIADFLRGSSLAPIAVCGRAGTVVFNDCRGDGCDGFDDVADGALDPNAVCGRFISSFFRSSALLPNDLVFWGG